MFKKISLGTLLLSGGSVMSMEQVSPSLEKLSIGLSEAHSSVIPEITSLEELAIRSSDTKPLVIDTYADWCPPCKLMAPLFEEIALECKEEFSFAKVNADTFKDFMKHYGITGLPTFIVLQGDKVLGKIVGQTDKEKFKKKLQAILAGPQDLSKLDKTTLNGMLFEAIQAYSASEVQELIAAGADVNALNERGMSPLFLALAFIAANPEEMTKIIFILLKSGCSQTIKTPNQETSLRPAVQNFIDTYSGWVKAYQTLAQKLDEENNQVTQEKSQDHSKKECTGDFCSL
jgi:thioredoxin 1